jgi:LCP family protein required for cell wall assembly
LKQIGTLDKSVAAVCILFSLLTMLLNAQSPVARQLLRGDRVTGLLIGSDYEDRTRHSDTLMYVSYDPSSRFLDVLSIPRDTMVKIPEMPVVRRVNEIFTYEFKHSNKDFNIASMALKSYVETLLSSGTAQGLSIPYYFTIDYATFRSLIDAMGGIYVRVTESMNYDDNWGHLHIHFTPGVYLMNGHTALLYVRYRGGGNADQGRITRQQIFIKDVLQRLKSPVVFFKIPKYARVVLDGIHTNFTAWDLLNLLVEGIHMRWKDLRLASLPGAPNGVLWKMNVEKTARILTLMQMPASRSAPAISDERDRSALETQGIPVVEVWNASNHQRITQTVVQLLRDKGFDVVRYGPFKTRQQRTLVIDRSGRLRPAEAVADVLRAASPDVISRIDMNLQVDVDVILGDDAAPLEKMKSGL